jgi:hypothetical protein
VLGYISRGTAVLASQSQTLQHNVIIFDVVKQLHSLKTTFILGKEKREGDTVTCQGKKIINQIILAGFSEFIF